MEMQAFELNVTTDFYGADDLAFCRSMAYEFPEEASGMWQQADEMFAEAIAVAHDAAELWKSILG